MKELIKQLRETGKYFKISIEISINGVYPPEYTFYYFTSNNCKSATFTNFKALKVFIQNIIDNKVDDTQGEAVEVLEELETEPCPECGGDGGNNANCKKCKGMGVIEVSESFFKK